MNERVTGPEYVSVEAAAERLGLSAGMVRRLLRDGKLQGLPPTDWQVELASVTAYKPGQRGRPKGAANNSQ